MVGPPPAATETLRAPRCSRPLETSSEAPAPRAPGVSPWHSPPASPERRSDSPQRQSASCSLARLLRKPSVHLRPVMPRLNHRASFAPTPTRAPNGRLSCAAPPARPGFACILRANHPVRRHPSRARLPRRRSSTFGASRVRRATAPGPRTRRVARGATGRSLRHPIRQHRSGELRPITGVRPPARTTRGAGATSRRAQR
jgi:hypothetical protein